MRFLLPLLVFLLPSCDRADRKKQLAECVDIYRTAYVTGGVRSAS